MATQRPRVHAAGRGHLLRRPGRHRPARRRHARCRPAPPPGHEPLQPVRLGRLPRPDRAARPRTRRGCSPPATTTWSRSTATPSTSATARPTATAGTQKRLDLPGNGPQTCPSVYSFVYGNVAVISVDANDLSAEIQTNTGYSDGAQLRWLEDTLQDWRTDPRIAPGHRLHRRVLPPLRLLDDATTTPPTAACGTRSTRCSPSTRSTWRPGPQPHAWSAPTRSGTARATRPAPDGSTIEPADDGVTYLCVGSGGRPRYPFRPAPGRGRPAAGRESDADRPAGAARGPALPRLPAGRRRNSTENNTENVLNSYVWSADGTAVNASGYPQGTKVPEDDRVVAGPLRRLRVHRRRRGAGAGSGRPTTMTIRTLADALPGTNEPYTRDRPDHPAAAGRRGPHRPRRPGTGARPDAVAPPVADRPRPWTVGACGPLRSRGQSSTTAPGRAGRATRRMERRLKASSMKASTRSALTGKAETGICPDSRRAARCRRGWPARRTGGRRRTR